MKTIYKYPIYIDDVQGIEMPEGAEVLHAGLDPQEKPSLWAKVDPSADITIVKRVFVIGTGHAIPEGANTHIGSFVHGIFVWHVFTR